MHVTSELGVGTQFIINIKTKCKATSVIDLTVLNDSRYLLSESLFQSSIGSEMMPTDKVFLTINKENKELKSMIRPSLAKVKQIDFRLDNNVSHIEHD